MKLLSTKKKVNAFKGIKAVVLDVDGVMTDGGLFVFANGEHVRKFNVKDGWGIKELMNQGFDVAVISAGSGEGLRRRLSHLGLKDIYLSTQDKLSTFRKYCIEKGLSVSEVAYMGDDMPDIEVLKQVGLACCPADAIDEVRAVCQYISKYKGGEGAVRDMAQKIIGANKKKS